MELKILSANDNLHEYSHLLPAALMGQIKKNINAYIILGALLDGKPEGVIVAGGEEGGILIYCLRVDFAYRGGGIGNALLLTLLEGIYKSDAAKDIVFRFTPENPILDEDPGFRFLSRFDVEFEQMEGGLYSVALGDLADSSFFNTMQQDAASFVPMSKVSAQALAKFNKKTITRLLLADAPYYGDGVLSDISGAIVIDDEVEGVAVISEREDALELSWLCVSPAYKDCLPGLLKGVYKNLCNNYGKEVILYIFAANNQSEALIEKLCPTAEFLPLIEAKTTIMDCLTQLRAINAANKMLD